MPVNEDGIHVTIRTTVDPRDIRNNLNKLNWKSHPERQLEYVGDSIKAHGWAGTMLYCANTDRLINGHGRLEICLEQGLTSIPIDVGYWTEEQGNELLATLDTVGNMVSVDAPALISLTEATLKRAMQGKKAATPQIGLMTDVHSYAQAIIKKSKDRIQIRQSKRSVKKIIGDTKRTRRDERETGSDHDSLYVTELRNDIIFPSAGNQYGIPDLRPSKLYTDTRRLPMDTFDRSGKSLLATNYYCDGSRPFDSISHAKPVGGTLGFFCEDHIFERYYRDPAKNAERLLEEKWGAIVEPDYSTYWDWPFAVRLWSIYRSRWCCRYWQQLGMKIIPLIRRTNDIERDQWMYSSLPPNTSIGFMQIRMGNKKNAGDPNYWSGIGAALDYCQKNIGLQFILFYGGISLEKYIIGKMPEGMKYRMIEPYINKRRPKRDPQTIEANG